MINTGKSKGTTFKIKVKDLAFSSLFDTGAQVSCIKYDTVRIGSFTPNLQRAAHV